MDLWEKRVLYWIMSLVMSTKLVWPRHHKLSSISGGDNVHLRSALHFYGFMGKECALLDYELGYEYLN